MHLTLRFRTGKGEQVGFVKGDAARYLVGLKSLQKVVIEIPILSWTFGWFGATQNKRIERLLDRLVTKPMPMDATG
jgi:hypothetical protein